MAMNWPREVCSAVSVAQTGTMAFKMPVPMPLTARAGKCQYVVLSLACLQVTSHVPHIIQSLFCAEHCNDAPTMAQAVPTAMVLMRPILSPSQPPPKHPNRVPR